MREFGKYIFILGLVIGILAYVLDAIYTTIFSNSNPRNKVELVTMLKNKKIDYIFLGSSRVENHIDCTLVEELTGKTCINLGIQGGRIKDYQVLATILKENDVRYDKLLVQVDYIYNFNNFSPVFKAQISPFINNDDFPPKSKIALENEIEGSIPFFRYAYNEKVIGFREALLKFFGKPSKVDLTNGFVPLEGVGTSISGHFPESLNYPNRELEDIIALDPASIILFTAPYCNSSITRDTFMNSLKNKYPELKDYTGLFDNEGGMSVNCGHLNKEGAQKFTEILTRDILID